MTDASTRPLRALFTPIYPGAGAGNIERLMGRPPSNDPPSEDWLASTTGTGRGDDPHHGTSLVELPDGGRAYLRDLIDENPAEMLGAERTSGELGVLAKFLDKKDRFGVQVHPTRGFAREHLDSDYGKAESWIILETHSEDPYVLLGWREPMTKERWIELVRTGDPEQITGALNRIPVAAGDVLYVDAGWVHAAGPGIFMVEVQEPSDHCVSVEWMCTGGKEPPETLPNGLTFDEAMSAFLYNTPTGDEFVALARQRQVPVYQSDDGVETALFEPWARKWFDATRVDVTGTFVPEIRPHGHVFVVVGGTGAMRCCGDGMELSPGDRFFVPATAAEYEFRANDGDTLTVIRCFAAD